MKLLSAAVIIGLLKPSDSAPSVSHHAGQARCHCLPGDTCWPTLQQWSQLNTTVSGRLIKTVPIGSVCHDPTYDAEACSALQANYTEPEPHYQSSSSVMERYWANQSCNPFAPRGESCADLGNYVSYAVNVSTPGHVAAAIQFAKEFNIRFVVRNTGHDFLGRSTGRGALAVWTHHLKSMELLPTYTSAAYSGPALKMGAGVQGFEASSFLAPIGYVSVGGWCPSVGIAGGFIAGGGHSPLGSKFGMGADQTLEFEVLTASGGLVKASPSVNADLYWALSGGGPGNYGVVTSVTIRVYPDAPVTGLFVMIDATAITRASYWAAIRTWFEIMPALVDNGIGATFSLDANSLYITPLTAHGLSLAATQQLVKPFTDKLSQLQIESTTLWLSSPGYNAHWSTFVTPGPVGSMWQSSARIVPRSIVATAQDLDSLLAELEYFVEDEGISIGGTTVGAVKRTNVDNAVLPAWRTGVALLGLLRPWSDSPQDWPRMLEEQRWLSQEMRPRLEAVTPGGGTYMNEGDYAQQNWRSAFFGSNYDQLISVKTKWDPQGVFWSLETPGSDKWSVASDGRMCRSGRW